MDILLGLSIFLMLVFGEHYWKKLINRTLANFAAQKVREKGKPNDI